jgi:hypothetical protein
VAVDGKASVSRRILDKWAFLGASFTKTQGEALSECTAFDHEQWLLVKAK